VLGVLFWAALLPAILPLRLLAADVDAELTLEDTARKEVRLGNLLDRKVLVVVFIGTECPVNNAYMRSLKQLHDEFAPREVRFVAINSNTQDSAERVAQHAQEHGLPFPVLIDADQRAADAFQAERTPEAFVLDDQRQVRYRGRIDDQFGVGFQRPAPTRQDLAEALREILAGKPVTTARTAAAGCLIARIKASPPTAPTPITYSNQIARLFDQRCVECHREGRVAPFALTSYAQAKGWAEMIREVVTEGRMPPWHADPRYGHFSNDRRLSPDERATLLAWIDDGCPAGNPQDLPTPKQFVEGWTIGEPDVILTMARPVTVPAKAPKRGIPYRHIIVPTRFEQDMWIQAAEARPGNRAVVHHILSFIREPGDNLQDPVDKVLVGHAPGDLPLILPPGVAMRIPKGSDLIFQMHYTANGVEQTDQSSVGLIFAKEPPQQVAYTRTINNYDFVIPPGESDYVVRSSFTFPKAGVILGLMPHMHLRGKSFQYELFYPDGRSEIVLWVPRYDFNWQSVYRLVSPLAVPVGTRVECAGTFDNSPENPNNPDPTQEVRWGDQTWEEMMGGLLDYYYVDSPLEGETAGP
jgi:peroxiredoxin/mono/diheme cytochrome c family protein